MNMHEFVKRFHEATLIPVGSKPSPLAPDRLKLRLKLFDEFFELLGASGMGDRQVEFLERLTKDAIDDLRGGDQDIVEMADALGDIVVVAFGMAIEMGVNLNRVLGEIMRANMSKLDEHGNPLINQCGRGNCEQPCMDKSHWPKPDDPHGKVLKASGYTPPDIAPLLKTQRSLI